MPDAPACRDPRMLEHVGDQGRAADDLDSGPTQTGQRLETGAADEENVGEIEGDIEAGSTPLLTFALEQIGPLQEDVSLKHQGHLVRLHVVEASDTKHGRKEWQPVCQTRLSRRPPGNPSRSPDQSPTLPWNPPSVSAYNLLS